MNHIIIAFFKVCGLTMIMALSVSFLLHLISFDITGHSLFFILAVIFFGGLTTIGSILLVYLPIYYLNKEIFKQENLRGIFERFAPIVILPVTITAIIFSIAAPHDFFDADVLLVFLMEYIIIYFSFYQFIRYVKE